MHSTMLICMVTGFHLGLVQITRCNQKFGFLSKTFFLVHAAEFLVEATAKRSYAWFKDHLPSSDLSDADVSHI